jgi:hypothetical protein
MTQTAKGLTAEVALKMTHPAVILHQELQRHAAQ